MKLLISDYDYTIKPYEKSPNILEKIIFKKNVGAINKFIEEGNKFIIATGRNTNSIKKETEKYGINYNYLIPYNGRVIVDNQDNLLYANYLDELIIEYLIESKKVDDFILFDEYASTMIKAKLIYIKAKLKSYGKLNDMINDLKNKYPELKIDYSYLRNMIMLRNEFNKSLGIKKLLEIEELDIDRSNIFTVGDEINDIQMLNDFNGTRMLLSNPELIFTTSKTTPTISALIKKIKKNI